LPPLDHLWSLAIEEQFYLIWPLILWFLILRLNGRRARITATLTGAGVSAVAMAAAYTPGNPSLVYYGTDTHAFALLIGAALALAFPLTALESTTAAQIRHLDAAGILGLVVLAWAAGHFSGSDPAVYPVGLILAASRSGATCGAAVGLACTTAPTAVMVTPVERSAVAETAGGMHGFPTTLTSFVGRAQVVDDIAGQLGDYRLVTVTGPGGAGKTRLAGEVAKQVAGRFADGVWLAELAVVRDPAQVAAAVAVALGIHDLPSVAAADALAHALARRQLLLVLDNCEHVIGAAAEVCGRLLLGADDVRVLATSREPLRIAGEVRYRLGPLTLPDPVDPAATGKSESVTLFADRARRADPGFAFDETTRTTVAQLVARLDGMPLAIELAAARVDALGVAQLLDRIDDRFVLLVDGDRLAEQRQRSLAAAVQWSYQLLDDSERRVFRAVSVFPGPFTLDGAEAVAGPGAGRAVPRLVDCSLLVPPRVALDGRTRYAMLETLRAYGAALLTEAGEDDTAAAALAAYAAEVVEEASAGLYTRTQEAASLRHLDAEDVTLRHALVWAMEHDPPTALRLALGLAPMWAIRGRLVSQAPLLAAAAEHADVGSDDWCGARMLLGQAAMSRADPTAALEHYAAVLAAVEDPGRAESWPGSGPVIRALSLGGRAAALLQAGRVAEAADDARRTLAVAREIGSQGLEAVGLACLAMTTWQAGDRDGALRLVRQAQAIPEEFAGGLDRGLSGFVTTALIEAGDLAGAEQACAAALASCRELGDLANLGGQLWNRTILDLRTGRVDDAAAHLREQLQIATQTGLRPALLASLDCCGHVCAATGRPAEAVTVWAARSALGGPWPLQYWTRNLGAREELLRKARRRLGPAGTRAAEERGAAMSLAAATEYALMLAAAAPEPPAGDGAAAGGAAAAAAGLAGLSPRERELVTLVAEGRTDAQIAAQLYITVRTVSSHLDRIRDKTGCRRRADLTRLALSAGLV
jgi:predicted ATPase/DNA-binding CsgD family transcriptional regulator